MIPKGSGKSCCCPGCSAPPWVQLSLLNGASAQHLCCACIPTQLCVQYLAGSCNPDYASLNTSALLALAQGCQGENPSLVTTAWTGNIFTGSTLSSISIALSPDPYDGTCSVCLTCADLGLFDVCLQLDDSIRAALCATCQQCQHITDPPIVQWTFDGGCLNVRAAPNTSLPAPPRHVDCPDPCLAPYAQEPYATDCGGPCDGCSCICNCLALYIVRNNDVTIESACNCNGVFTSESGYQITLTNNMPDSNCCVLKLTGFGSTDPGHAIPAPIAVGHLSKNPCPNVSGQWFYHDLNDKTGSGEVSIYFTCVGCDGLPTAVSKPCCPNPIPKLLKAELTMIPVNCLCPNAAPVDVLFDMIYDESQIAWVGNWNCPTPHDPTPYPEVAAITFKMGCGYADVGGVIKMSAPVVSGSPYYTSGTCDPVNFTFQWHGDLEIGTCGLGSIGPPIIPAGPYVVTIKVTE